MNRKYARKLMAMSTAFFMAFSMGCKKDNEDPNDPQAEENEPESISTVHLDFVSQGGGNVVTVKWSDLDGPGGNAPVMDSILLDSGEVYLVSISFLDESGSEVEDITAEVKSEADEHRVCYQIASIPEDILEVVITDDDGEFPIGLESKWSALMQGSGSVIISLLHQPDGMKDGTCDPGDTDLEVSFDLKIQ